MAADDEDKEFDGDGATGDGATGDYGDDDDYGDGRLQFVVILNRWPSTKRFQFTFLMEKPHFL